MRVKVELNFKLKFDDVKDKDIIEAINELRDSRNLTKFFVNCIERYNKEKFNRTETIMEAKEENEEELTDNSRVIDKILEERIGRELNSNIYEKNTEKSEERVEENAGNIAEKSIDNNNFITDTQKSTGLYNIKSDDYVNENTDKDVENAEDNTDNNEDSNSEFDTSALDAFFS